MEGLKLIAKDFTNCWLSYVLSQPVDFDFLVVVYFFAEYTGLFLVAMLVKNVFFHGQQVWLSLVVRREFDEDDIQTITAQAE